MFTVYLPFCFGGGRAGVTFLLGQLTVGLGLLTTLNVDTIAMGFVCVPAVMAYPLMKRMTSYPQAWLGLCMNWGVLMGGTAVAGFGGGNNDRAARALLRRGGVG